MNAIDLMMEEHKEIRRLLKVMRKLCFNLMENKEVDYKDFDEVVYFIKNYADKHHHRKEEDLLFNVMLDNLGVIAEKVIKYGMLVEHDFARLYVMNLEEALKKLKEGDIEAKLDVIANAISYTHLLERHADKEDKVVYTFATKQLSEEHLKDINIKCQEYENMNNEEREKCIGILDRLELKII